MDQGGVVIVLISRGRVLFSRTGTFLNARHRAKYEESTIHHSTTVRNMNTNERIIHYRHRNEYLLLLLRILDLSII